MAASSAAPAAIRAICQSGMPPMTTVWVTGADGLNSAPGGGTGQANTGVNPAPG